MTPGTLLFFALFFLQVPDKRELEKTCLSFQKLNTQIRDGRLPKQIAKDKLVKVLWQLKTQTPSPKITPTWVFPVSGYGLSAIGGKNGNGFRSRGYHFLDGNKHGGHPAHDVFIVDRNQDSKDDLTLKKVPVLTILPGVVVAVETHWHPNSPLRGGKYVMVFHPAEDLISYYAHLDSVQVVPGEHLTAGAELGKLGRTGLNAAKKRSPTHLHIMVLKIDATEGLKAIDPYSKWKKNPGSKRSSHEQG